jgi:hypothetical protein
VVGAEQRTWNDFLVKEDQISIIKKNYKYHTQKKREYILNN